MELARKFQEEEGEPLFLSPKTQETQAINEQFRLIVLEKQNRRLKGALTLLSFLLLATILGSGYLYHRMLIPGRATRAARQEGLPSASHATATSPKRTAVKSPEGEDEAVGSETTHQKGASEAVTAPNADVVISVKFKEEDHSKQADGTVEVEHNPTGPSITPASSPATATEGAAQLENAARAESHAQVESTAHAETVAQVQNPAQVETAAQAEATSKVIEREPVVRYVGSKTSNKYHFPDCKWVKLIRPERLLTFASVEEARKTNPIACPTCRPPLKDAPESAKAAETEP